MRSVHQLAFLSEVLQRVTSDSVRAAPGAIAALDALLCTCVLPVSENAGAALDERRLFVRCIGHYAMLDAGRRCGVQQALWSVGAPLIAPLISLLGISMRVEEYDSLVVRCTGHYAMLVAGRRGGIWKSGRCMFGE